MMVDGEEERKEWEATSASPLNCHETALENNGSGKWIPGSRNRIRKLRETTTVNTDSFILLRADLKEDAEGGGGRLNFL